MFLSSDARKIASMGDTIYIWTSFVHELGQTIIVGAKKCTGIH